MVMNNAMLEDKILEIGRNRSIITRNELFGLGATETNLKEFERSGLLQYSTTETYMPGNANISIWHTEVEVTACVPQGVICLANALVFHQLTTQRSPKVWIALPEDEPKISTNDLPLKITYMSDLIYQQGIDTYILEGFPVKVYNVPKTIVDCFEFADEIGMEVATEVVEEAIRKNRCTVDELKHHASYRYLDREIRQDFEEAINNPEKIQIFI